MIDSQICINVKENRQAETVLQARRYEEWVARFCYAAAKLPTETVEHILGLMEVAGDPTSEKADQ